MDICSETSQLTDTKGEMIESVHTSHRECDIISGHGRGRERETHRWVPTASCEERAPSFAISKSMLHNSQIGDKSITLIVLQKAKEKRTLVIWPVLDIYQTDERQNRLDVA